VKLAKKNIVGRVFLLKFVLMLSLSTQNMKNFTFLLIVMIFGGLHSCQKDEITESNSPQSLTKSSTLSSLMARVSQSPTSKDNILDGTSCFAVVLPVSLTVNSSNVTVVDNNSYQTVRDIVDEYSSDDDVIHFNFPIRLKFADFHEVEVANQEAYESILENCGDDEGLHDIACIDFNFPLVLKTYNSATQIPNTVSVSSNSQLYNFLNGLTANVVYNISYPVSMTSSSGSTVVYNSNSELQTGIENSIDDCDDEGSGTELFSDLIVNGAWKISSFIDGDEDETYHYTGYVFSFSSTGTSLAAATATSLNGNWSYYAEDNLSKLTLSYFGETLDELEEDWQIIEFNSTFIKLRHISGGNGNTHYLTFTKI
jgi:hypothetical protein